MPTPRARSRALDPALLAEGVAAGERVALARAITLLESSRERDRVAAGRMLDVLMSRTGRGVRIGLTGVPGAGKSTLIERLGLMLADRGQRLAVLAVDPSSARTGGAILGDKTRMPRLSTHPNAFVRPSASGSSLGGVAARTRESILLCEAAGFDTVIVETVGVGQSETAVAEMTDVFLALLLPGAGDELQGIKRGLIELADVLAVNKADGEQLAGARRAVAEYRSALNAIRPADGGEPAPVLMCSAATGKGVSELWDTVTRLVETRRADGRLERRRVEQGRRWFDDAIGTIAAARALSESRVARAVLDARERLAAGVGSPTTEAERVASVLRDALGENENHNS
ncbi:MAG: methylmalonyl Co-A mutase-associated GTPase MeaB [Planctomycetota bacterium]